MMKTGDKSESPTTLRAGSLDFLTIGGKKQRHTSDLISASVKVQPWNRATV